MIVSEQDLQDYHDLSRLGAGFARLGAGFARLSRFITIIDAEAPTPRGRPKPRRRTGNLIL